MAWHIDLAAGPAHCREHVALDGCFCMKWKGNACRLAERKRYPCPQLAAEGLDCSDCCRNSQLQHQLELSEVLYIEYKDCILKLPGAKAWQAGVVQCIQAASSRASWVTTWHTLPYTSASDSISMQWLKLLHTAMQLLIDGYFHGCFHTDNQLPES